MKQTHRLRDLRSVSSWNSNFLKPRLRVLVFPAPAPAPVPVGLLSLTLSDEQEEEFSTIGGSGELSAGASHRAMPACRRIEAKSILI